MKTKATVRTCGKLYLTGEYAVLYPGQAAIIKAIPIYMTGLIEPSECYHLASDLFSHTASLLSDPAYALVQETIKLMNTYLLAQAIQPRPFSLTIKGKMEENGRKFGLGSSGSTVLLTLKAMAALYELELGAELLFKLGSAVLLKRGDNGSMGDLACIAYEDLICYQSFDRAAIRCRLAEQDLLSVLAADWGYRIRRLAPALPCDFLVGWTREPAISQELVRQVRGAVDAAFLAGSQKQTESLEQALLTGDKAGAKASLAAAGALLQALSPAIYTEKLAALQAAAQGLDCAAKSSGAGGGDCGIALSFDAASSQNLIDRWQAAGIALLYQERMGHDPQS